MRSVSPPACASCDRASEWVPWGRTWVTERLFHERSHDRERQERRDPRQCRFLDRAMGRLLTCSSADRLSRAPFHSGPELRLRMKKSMWRLSVCSFHTPWIATHVLRRDAVQSFMSAIRKALIRTPHSSDILWCIRFRSVEDLLRTAPFSRALYLPHKNREAIAALWTIERHHAINQDSVWASRTPLEQCLLHRNATTGIGSIEPDIFSALGMPGEAAEWLARIL